MYLVTGASGFTGGHLVRHLVRKGVPVRAMVRKAETGKPLADIGAEVVVADLQDGESLLTATHGVTGVYHVAALFREARLGERDYFRVNLDGTKKLLDASIANGVSRFIHCSTVGVLGNVAVPPATEETPYNPGDYYQRSKVAGEQLALEYFRGGKIRGAVIRPGMIWGPGDTRVLKLFRMIAQRRFFYVGQGKALVHFVDVRDLAEAFYLAMGNQNTDGEIFTIAGSESVPLHVVVNAIAGECGVNPPRVHVPVKPLQLAGTVCETICRPLGIEPPLHRRRVDFFTKNRCFDISKAQRVLGFVPQQSLRGEIRDMVAWYRAHGWIGSPARGFLARLIPNRSAYMVRDFEGTIVDWSDDAIWHYGFDASDARGAVSHQLLRTEFPDDVKEINDRLQSERSWDGLLLHTRKDGSKVRVKSRWVLVPEDNGSAQLVVETNRFIPESSQGGISTGTALVAVQQLVFEFSGSVFSLRKSVRLGL